MSLTWYEWFKTRKFKTSFADDHHAGGSFKHMKLVKEDPDILTFYVVGYYGIDELIKLKDMPENKELDTTGDFLEKYKNPFHAQIIIARRKFMKKLTVPCKCTFLFKKDTHASSVGMMTTWTYNEDNDTITIEFDDKVERENGRIENNKWISTDLVPYERDATLQYIDRTLLSSKKKFIE